MNHRAFVLAAVALALLAVAPVAVAQSGGGAGNVTSSSGDYPLAELQNGGTELENGPASQRFIGDYGSAVIRHEPVGPLQSDWEYLERGTTLNSDEVRLRTVRLAPSDQLDRTLNVTVVGWERGTKPSLEGNRSVDRQAAVNQTVYEQRVTLGRGYDEATIQLPQSYGHTETVTMWIEGYPDARWKFQHLSVPSTQKVDIGTEGEAWSYAAMTVIIPGVIGAFLGFWGGRKTLERTASGPRWPLIIWGLIVGVGLFAILSSWYFQVAVVLTYAPYLLGGVFAILGYGLALWSAGSPSTVGFYRPELFDARLGPAEREVKVVATDGSDDPEPIPDGGQLTNGDGETADPDRADGSDEQTGPGSGLDDIKEVRYVDLMELPALRTPSGKIRVPKRGIRPFFARMFADAAEIDKSDLVTKIEVSKGRLDELVLVDPEADEPVTHEPAHLERRWPFVHKLEGDEDWSKKLASMAGLGIVLSLPAIGFMAGSQVGVPMLAAAVGALPLIITSHTARDGWIDFEPANQHFQRAQATLVDLQREQADGKTLEAFREQAWSERARTAQEAVDLAEQHDRTLTEEMLSERAGFKLIEPSETDGDDPTPDAGGDSNDD
jgi:hypothetical protein